MRRGCGKSAPAGPVRSALRWAPALSALAACQPCDPSSDRPPEPFEGGVSDPEAGVYESSAVGGSYLPFGPGQSYSFAHGLGTTPRGLSAFLSISACPLCEGADVGFFASAAGNEVVWEAADAEHVVVRNDTCADFFVRVVLSLPGGQ